MATITSTENSKDNSLMGTLKKNAGMLAILIVMIIFPFLVAFFDGQSVADVLSGETGSAKFLQGLLIEVFILAIFALSYDLVLGITGLLSFGHAMFFATGAYFAGIAFKSLELGLAATLLGIVVIGILQALLFGIVLPRVKGITFALVTLGFASVFFIIIQASELAEWTGSDVGLQGVIVPEVINTTNERYRLYLIALLSVFFMYLIYRRFVDSPTGRVCVATRENEDRALMLGYNTFHFKLVALIISSITAAYAGFLHTVHQPIVSPNIAGLGWTVAALLIILIGGVGTLSGAIIGAAVFRLLEFYLDKWFGEYASFLLGLLYILIVLFLPFGIVGTWRLRAPRMKEGWERLLRLFSGKNGQPNSENK